MYIRMTIIEFVGTFFYDFDYLQVLNLQFVLEMVQGQQTLIPMLYSAFS